MKDNGDEPSDIALSTVFDWVIGSWCWPLSDVRYFVEWLARSVMAAVPPLYSGSRLSIIGTFSENAYGGNKQKGI